jgi:hypothetical protein
MYTLLQRGSKVQSIFKEICMMKILLIYPHSATRSDNAQFTDGLDSQSFRVNVGSVHRLHCTSIACVLSALNQPRHEQQEQQSHRFHDSRQVALRNCIITRTFRISSGRPAPLREKKTFHRYKKLYNTILNLFYRSNTLYASTWKEHQPPIAPSFTTQPIWLHLCVNEGTKEHHNVSRLLQAQETGAAACWQKYETRISPKSKRLAEHSGLKKLLNGQTYSRLSQVFTRYTPSHFSRASTHTREQ